MKIIDPFLIQADIQFFCLLTVVQQMDALCLLTIWLNIHCSNSVEINHLKLGRKKHCIDKDSHWQVNKQLLVNG